MALNEELEIVLREIKDRKRRLQRLRQVKGESDFENDPQVEQLQQELARLEKERDRLAKLENTPEQTGNAKVTKY
jgi:hypothetical protein